MNKTYQLGMLKLVSDIDFPELLPWADRPDAPTELVFRLGSVPVVLEGGDRVDGWFQAQNNSRYLMAFQGAGRILIENGREVTVDVDPEGNLTDVRAILMGSAQAALWLQRGLLPLHASVVSINNKALALAGPSGVGKSTLAAALSAEGCAVMADDICAIDTADGAAVLPITPRLRLWRDALEQFGMNAEDLPRALARREKYLAQESSRLVSERRKLAALVLLSRGNGDAVTIERLRGARAVIELHSLVRMLRAVRALRLEAVIFGGLTDLLSAGVTVWRAVMPKAGFCSGEAAARILTLLGH